jgi:N4-gp56 family major capsid protein
MSFSGMNYGDISPRVGIYAVAKMLAHATPILVLEKFAKVEALPKNKGLTIKWRRPVPFEVSPVALTEGVTPAPQIMEYEDVTSVISQYGAWVAITDVIADTHEDPVLSNITELMAEQAAATKEAIVWSVIRAGTNVFYSGSATSRATVEAPLDEAELRLVQRELKGNHGKHITRMLSASEKVATEPVAPGFIAFGHSNLEQDLRDLNGFVVREKYASGALMDQEIGKFEDIRFILTPHLEPFFGAGSSTTTGVLNTNSKVDVYPIVVIAQDAFGVTPLKGMESVSVKVKNPGEVSYVDPLGQRGMVSWKMWYVATRLNESWMVRIECAASAL